MIEARLPRGLRTALVLALAQSDEELNAIEEEIDSILKAELAKQGSENSDAMTAAALSLAAQRLDHLIDSRRCMLASPVSPAVAA